MGLQICQERLQGPGLFSLEMRKLKNDLTTVFKHRSIYYKEDQLALSLLKLEEQKAAGIVKEGMHTGPSLWHLLHGAWLSVKG